MRCLDTLALVYKSERGILISMRESLAPKLRQSRVAFEPTKLVLRSLSLELESLVLELVFIEVEVGDVSVHTHT